MPPAMESPAALRGDNDRSAVLDLCRRSLAEEGFRVAVLPRGAVNLRASRGNRVVQVLVVLAEDVDSEETAGRIRDAYAREETRVFVPWRMKWRMASNLERWGLRGVAVSVY